MRVILIKIVATIVIVCIMGAFSEFITQDNRGQPGPIPFIVSLVMIAAIVGVWTYKSTEKDQPKTEGRTLREIKGVTSQGTTNGLETFLTTIAILIILGLLILMIKGVKY